MGPGWLTPSSFLIMPFMESLPVTCASFRGSLANLGSTAAGDWPAALEDVVPGNHHGVSDKSYMIDETMLMVS